MRAAGRMTDTRTPPNPRSDARPEPRRRARKTTHPVMRGGRGGVVSPYGQPSRESTPPYAAINAASPAAECAHDASVSHRSLIQVFAIPAAHARRGGPHRHPTRTTRTRPTTTNGCSPQPGGDPARHPRLHARAMAIRTPRTALRHGRQTHPIPPIRPRPMDRRQHRLPGEMTGTRKAMYPMCTRWPSTRKNKRAESLKSPPFSVGPAGLEPRPAGPGLTPPARHPTSIHARSYPTTPGHDGRNAAPHAPNACPAA